MRRILGQGLTARSRRLGGSMLRVRWLASSSAAPRTSSKAPGTGETSTQRPARRRAPRPKRDVLQITEKAADRMKFLLSKKGEDVIGIRLGVKSRGCNGKSYTMQYITRPHPADDVVEQHGVTLFVDSKALMFVIGTVVDFVEDHIKSEFVFMNPNAKGACGCGESFNV